MSAARRHLPSPGYLDLLVGLQHTWKSTSFRIAMDTCQLRSRVVAVAMASEKEGERNGDGDTRAKKEARLRQKARRTPTESQPSQPSQDAKITNPNESLPGWMRLDDPSPQETFPGKTEVHVTDDSIQQVRPELYVRKGLQNILCKAPIDIVKDSQKPPLVMELPTSDSEGGGSIESGDEPDEEVEEDSEADDLIDQEMSDEDLPDKPEQRNSKEHPSNARKGKEKVDSHRRNSKGKGEPRQIVDEGHVGVMLKYYRKHMADFTKGKKKKIKQLIPAKVWVEVQADYKATYPNSSFCKNALKENLQKALIEIKFGVNDPKTRGAETHDEDIMAELMQTEGAKERNVLRTRMGACHQVSSGSGKHAGEASHPGTPQVISNSRVPPAPAGKPLTKSQQLKVAGENMEDILSEVRGMKEVLLQPKGDETSKRKLDEEKVEILKSKRRGQDAQNILAEIQLLKEHKALGLLSEEEFKDACKAKFASRNPV